MPFLLTDLTNVMIFCNYCYNIDSHKSLALVVQTKELCQTIIKSL